jgi:hypothetical protein
VAIIWRDVIEGSERYQLRESPADYKAFFRAEKDDIGFENTYFLNDELPRSRAAGN